jgi:hypothetical protein
MESAKPVARKVSVKGRVVEIGLKRRKHIITLEVSENDVTAVARAGALSRMLDVEFLIPLGPPDIDRDAPKQMEIGHGGRDATEVDRG